jgi:hypothetical protein
MEQETKHINLSPKLKKSLTVNDDGELVPRKRKEGAAKVKNHLAQARKAKHKKKDREAQKRGRDFAQAKAVADLISQRMPHLDVSQIHALPFNLREQAKAHF